MAAIQTDYSSPRRGHPGHITTSSPNRWVDLYRLPDNGIEPGIAVHLDYESGSICPGVGSYNRIVASFVGVTIRPTTSSGMAEVLSFGKILVRITTPVRRGDKVLVSASGGTFSTGEPSDDHPELLGAQYMDECATGEEAELRLASSSTMLNSR